MLRKEIVHTKDKTTPLNNFFVLTLFNVWTISSGKFMSENCNEGDIRLTYGPNRCESKVQTKLVNGSL